jgi:hypothetical protein
LQHEPHIQDLAEAVLGERQVDSVCHL